MLKALRRTFFVPAALSLSALFSPCQASVVYDESVNGDLSTTFSSPTFITTHYGSNQILGSTGRVSTVVDRDYFTITIPVDQRLASIKVLANTTGDSSGTLVSFFSVQSGSTGTDPSTAQAALASSLLGYHLFGPGDIGLDILDNMGQSNLQALPAQGFNPPLGAGTYTFWVQETVNNINYGFDLKIVPEPESLTLLTLGLAGMLASSSMRRRLAG